MSLLLEDIEASVLGFAKDIAADLVNLDVCTEVEIVNLDYHADQNELPLKDMIGIMDFSATIDDGIVTTEFMIGASSYDDPNLFRLRKMCAVILDRVLPTKRFVIYDADTGAEIGKMVVQNGTHVMPMMSDETRTGRFIAVSALSDQIATA